MSVAGAAGAAGASPESVDRVDRRQVCLATQEKGTAAKDAWMGTATHGEVGATAMRIQRFQSQDKALE